MELVKETKDYSVFKKRSGRYGVKSQAGKWLNADEKVKVLLSEKLIKITAPAKKEEAPAEETAE